MFIGIKLTPQKTGLPVPAVFYCGRDPAAMRAEHAKLLGKEPEGTRFHYIHHPLLTPLQNVVQSTEDHPDIVAANKRRHDLVTELEKKAAEEKPAEAGTTSPAAPKKPLTEMDKLLQKSPADIRKTELQKLKVRDLQAVVERCKATGLEIQTGTGTKAELVDAILKAEGFELPAAPEKTEEENAS